jgi:NAD(P)-dependent dehydrogenase (short-subunit alcohol dehydrogenase family)
MQVAGSVALVTGANRGIGAQFVRGLLDRGASKVYAAARDTTAVKPGPGIVPVRLDVTDPDQVADLAAELRDVTLVVNNAGVSQGAPLLGAPDLAAARREMDVNYFGTLAVSRAFAPVLQGNGGGALVNMLSVLSFMNLPGAGSYSASKAAAWSLTNGIRIELARQNTLVVGVHPGFVDTDMTARVDAPKIKPAEVVDAALDAVEQGLPEVLVDEVSRRAKAALPDDQALLYPDLAAQWAARLAA